MSGSKVLWGFLFVFKSVNVKAGGERNLNSQHFLSIQYGLDTVLSAFNTHSVSLNPLNSSMRWYFYNLFPCGNSDSERLDKIVSKDTQ